MAFQILQDPDITVGPFKRGATVDLTGYVMDSSNPRVGIPGASLATARLSVFDEADRKLIVKDRDVKALILTGGAFVIVLAEADMAMVNANADFEWHRAVLVWTWNGGDGQPRTGKFEYRFKVLNTGV